jgi:hypothetical protein
MANTNAPLFTLQNYELDIPYYSGYIVEYDIRKANINALRSRGVIDDSLYNMLFNADKQFREVYVGNMIKANPDIYKEIQIGIIDAKAQFFKANNIKNEEVLSIKNDAVFVLSSRKMKTQFDLYEFANKGYYTFYFKSLKKQFFYRFDKHTNTDIIEVKGISEEKLVYHKDFFLKFLLDVFYTIERSSIEETLSYCNQFYEQYVSKRLDIHFYRELSPDNAYRITRTDGRSYGISYAEPQYLDLIDINYNLRIIRDLINVVNMIYFNQK